MWYDKEPIDPSILDEQNLDKARPLEPVQKQPSKYKIKKDRNNRADLDELNRLDKLFDKLTNPKYK